MAMDSCHLLQKFGLNYSVFGNRGFSVFLEMAMNPAKRYSEKESTTVILVITILGQNVWRPV